MSDLGRGGLEVPRTSNIVSNGRSEAGKLEFDGGLINSDRWETGAEIELKCCRVGVHGVEREWCRWIDVCR